MAQNVADQLVATLASARVKRIYGIVGDSLNAITDAVRRCEGMEWIHVRHEEVAAFAAGAEAHLTGSLAVCAGSCGPGNLHLINGLYDCHRSRVPVLAIAAHIPSAEIGRVISRRPTRRSCSASAAIIASSSPARRRCPRVLEIAIREALGKGAFRSSCIPGDVALQDAPQRVRRREARPRFARADRRADRRGPRRARRAAQRRAGGSLFCAAPAARARTTSCSCSPRGSRRRSFMPCGARNMSSATIPLTSG